MSVSLNEIAARVRYLLGDIEKVGRDVFSYATSSVFTLTEENATEVLSVSINDVAIADTLWAYDNELQKVTIAHSMNTGDTVLIEYKFNCSHSDTEIKSFIRASVVHISSSNYEDYIISIAEEIYPEPSEREKNLIAGITALIIDPDNKGYRLPDVSVSFPSDLPTHDKIRKYIAIFKKNSHGSIDVL